MEMIFVTRQGLLDDDEAFQRPTIGAEEIVYLLFTTCIRNISQGKMGLFCKISRQVALNGKTLKVIDDHTLPQLVPVQQSASQGIKLPALTFGFFVFPEANAATCK